MQKSTTAVILKGITESYFGRKKSLVYYAKIFQEKCVRQVDYYCLSKRETTHFENTEFFSFL